MSASVGQPLSGLLSPRARPDQPAKEGGGGEDARFGDFLDSAPKPKPGKKQIADSPVWHRPVAAKGKLSEPAEVDAKSAIQAEPAEGIEVADDVPPDQPAATQPSNQPPLNDRLPLLMVFQDLRLAAHKAANGHAEASADEAANPTPVLNAGRTPNLDPDRKHIADIGPKPSITALSDLPAGQPDQAGKILPSSSKDIVASIEAGTTDDAPPDTVRNARISTAEPVTVISERSFPAPAAAPNQTVSAVTSAIAGDAGLQKALASSVPQGHAGVSVAVATHVLKIELHPAELGMVTASMRLSGEQLSIELKPENHEAYRRLSSDSDAIVKSLRSLGFDVDNVTILQPSIAVSASARIDTSAAPNNAAGRDQPSFQTGGSGGDGTGGGSQQSGKNRNHEAHQHGHASSPIRQNTSDGLFI